jgi:hypothetical protein
MEMEEYDYGVVGKHSAAQASPRVLSEHHRRGQVPPGQALRTREESRCAQKPYLVRPGAGSLPALLLGQG